MHQLRHSRTSQLLAVIFSTWLLSIGGCNWGGGDEGQPKRPSGTPTTHPGAHLHKVIGCDNPDRRLDVVFLHGVDGHHLETWHPDGKPNDYWPRWLGEDIENIGVWSLHYPVATTPFRGETMNLIDRGTSVLSLMEAEGFSDHPDIPVIFIAHSFGGLVTKQVLESADDSTKEEWKAILGRARGVVFIATPNSGSNLADYISFLGKLLTTVTVEELKRGGPYLLKLNRWYRDHAPELGVDTLVFAEERMTLGLKVVDKESADPGISGVTPIPMDSDHIDICKPNDQEDPLYKQVVRFIKKALRQQPPPDMPDPTASFEDGGAVNPPSAEDVAQPPATEAERVVLTYQNNTGRNLRLALYDWSRHFAQQNGRWRFLKLPLRSEERRFEDFIGADHAAGSTGWFSAYVVTPGNAVSSCLLTANLFAARKPRMVVKDAGLGPKIDFSFD